MVVADDPIRVRHFLAALTTHATAVIAIVSIIKDQYGHGAIGLITQCPPAEGASRGRRRTKYCACSQSNRSALAYNRQTVKTVAMCMRAIYNIYNKYNQLICPLVSTGNLPTGCPLVICHTGLYAGVKKLVPLRSL